MITTRRQAPITISRTLVDTAAESNILLGGEAIHIPPGGVVTFRMSVSVVTTGDISAVDAAGPFEFVARRYSGDDVGITGTDVAADVLTKTLATSLTFRVRPNDADGIFTGVMPSIQDARESGGSRTLVVRVTYERLSEVVGLAPIAKP